jgi:hypothetical protein
MKGPLGILLLVWSMVQGRVIEPFVEEARTALAETREEVAGLERRWRALGVSAEVTEPVDAISDVAERSLELPQEMTEAYESVVGADQDGRGQDQRAAARGSAYRTGSQITQSCSAVERGVESDVGPCSTHLEISNADPWREEEWFYVTVLLLSTDGRQLGRHTRRLSAGDGGPWVVDLVKLAGPASAWRGLATITVHHQLGDGSEAPSEDARVLVETTNPCPPGEGPAGSQ